MRGGCVRRCSLLARQPILLLPLASTPCTPPRPPPLVLRAPPRRRCPRLPCSAQPRSATGHEPHPRRRPHCAHLPPASRRALALGSALSAHASDTPPLPTPALHSHAAAPRPPWAMAASSSRRGMKNSTARCSRVRVLHGGAAGAAQRAAAYLARARAAWRAALVPTLSLHPRPHPTASPSPPSLAVSGPLVVASHMCVSQWRVGEGVGVGA